MKKYLFLASMFALSLSSARAQVAYEKANFLDNVYVGAEVGATTKLNFNSVFPLNPVAGIKLGKNFSPVFGANLEGLVGFGENTTKPFDSKTFVKVVNLGLNGTMNLTNLFCGYDPNKTFHLGLEAGIGMAQFFGDPILDLKDYEGDNTELTAKTGLTFAWDLGETKAWQLYVEPAILWNLTHGPGDAVQFNRQQAQLGLFFGVNYKFKTSNGTHDFKV